MQLQGFIDDLINERRFISKRILKYHKKPCLSCGKVHLIVLIISIDSKLIPTFSHPRALYLNHRTRTRTTFKRFPTSAKFSRWIHSWRSSASSRSSTNRFTTTTTLITWLVITIPHFTTSRCNLRFPFCPRIRNGFDSSRASGCWISWQIAQFLCDRILFPVNPQELIFKIQLCVLRKVIWIEFNDEEKIRKMFMKQLTGNQGF